MVAVQVLLGSAPALSRHARQFHQVLYGEVDVGSVRPMLQGLAAL
jgi:hypothetical protein